MAEKGRSLIIDVTWYWKSSKILRTWRELYIMLFYMVPLTKRLNNGHKLSRDTCFLAKSVLSALEYRKVRYPIDLFGFFKRDNLLTVSSSPSSLLRLISESLARSLTPTSSWLIWSWNLFRFQPQDFEPCLWHWQVLGWSGCGYSKHWGERSG